MNELTLRSFLQLTAGLAHLKKDEPIQILLKYVESYIEHKFGSSFVAEKLVEFNHFYQVTKEETNLTEYIRTTCDTINRELSLKQKTNILINIFNFYTYSSWDIVTIFDHKDNILQKISVWLNISTNEYLCLKYFSTNHIHQIPLKDTLLFVASENPNLSGIKYLENKNLNGYILFIYLPIAKVLLFSYNGSSSIEINGKTLYAKVCYEFSSGLIISGAEIESIYYGHIIKTINQTAKKSTICLNATNIYYKYNESNNGIKNLSLTAFSGELIGILGGSGVGKSTLLKLLSGELKPTQGDITVNGHNVYGSRQKLKDITGTLHQEECLLEELTVYENLYFNTKLALGGLADNEVKQKVEETLFNLDLVDCAHNRVGPPGNRQLSGGQRKRLAIANEIIRDPEILFVDEPTSGLSSSDSDAVMSILKSSALEGKLVVVNIHQPSSDIFKLFNRVIIIDKGGIPIYSGNPIEAILHFKGIASKVDKHQSGCECCGNLKPEILFTIIEEREVDELGNRISKRKLSPDKWNELLVKDRVEIEGNGLKTLPPSKNAPAKPINQFFVYLKRIAITKIRNVEFVVLALVLPPILAYIISVFLRYSLPAGSESAEYSFFLNPNLATFFLMCVLASLFFGIILSCEEIFRDKQLIVREKSIGLSLKSFYNAKFSFLAILSLYQTFCFALLGLLIIDFKGFTIHLWLMLFMVSLFGNLLGLIVSSTLKSIVAIYVLVPFLLIPQILFSGLVVNFDNLNPKLSSQGNVPFVGELMITRWAEEALIVHYYVNNKYNKPFFVHDYHLSETKYLLLHLIPELQKTINELNVDSVKNKLANRLLIEDGIKTLSLIQATPSTKQILYSADSIFSSFANQYLSHLNDVFAKKYSSLNFQIDRAIETIYPNTEVGRENLKLDRNMYANQAIDYLVRNRYCTSPIVREGNTFIQKSDPIFRVSKSLVGRSHFLAPYKMVANTLVKTYWYNFAIGLLMILALYTLFIFNFFPSTSSAIQSTLIGLKRHLQKQS